jgi:predicted CXXCH cytochrome family protein
MSNRHPEPRRENAKAGIALGAILGGLLFCCPALLAQTSSDIVDTRHNLAVSGPGPVRALTETRICVFCHTPHDAAPASPLWNKELEPQTYTLYASPTLKATPLPQPTGPTKLCLSCHDGTIAIGAVLNPAGGIGFAGSGTLPPGTLSDFGLDLSGHHPVSFSYHDAQPNPELASTPPSELHYGAADVVHCSTCHDPHNDRFGKFLVADNRASALCVKCHVMNGWSGSAHATSTASVAGILPRAPKTWPRYGQLGDWGCEACHTPHFAPTAPQLLNFTDLPPAFSCTTSGCHGETPGGPHGMTAGAAGFGQAAIGTQLRKASAHRLAPGTFGSAITRTGGSARSGIRAVDCADCHNPHAANGRRAEPPFVSGALQAVPGVDRYGAPLQAARYEYEICFKCHADTSGDLEMVPRVIPSTNARLDFDPTNPSYHPVIDIGRTLDMPSIPSTAEPAMRPSQRIYCTTCHADDEGGARGPHGSSFPPILVRRYDTADGTTESYDGYALCYQCHERSRILQDVSFRRALQRTSSGGGHSGHLLAGIACAACHDPHGVQAGAASTGDHTHLVNFDTRVVLPLPGTPYPVFEDKGRFTGNCSLVCHGVVHDRAAYP